MYGMRMMMMARLNVYVSDELAERARRAGLNVSAVTQSALSAELDRRDLDGWLDAMPAAEVRITHAEVLAALDAAREEDEP